MMEETKMENTLEDAESKKGRMVIRFVGVVFSDVFRDGLQALNQIKPRGGWVAPTCVFHQSVIGGTGQYKKPTTNTLMNYHHGRQSTTNSFVYT